MAAKQQVVEPDHLAKALLEQPNGLARRIVVKVSKNLSATQMTGHFFPRDCIGRLDSAWL